MPRHASTSTVARERAAPVLSVVIVNYLSYLEVRRCLESLEAHLDVPYELIVIDHASDAERLANLQAAFPGTVFVPIRANPGFAAGVNAGARRASGTYLWLLNPDTVLIDPAARGIVEWLEQHPDVAVVGSLVLDPQGTVQASARWFPGITTAFGGRTSWLSRRAPSNWLSRRNLVTDLRDGSPRQVDWVAGSSMFVRRSAFESVGGMDEAFFLYWEDADLCRRLMNVGWRTVFYPSTGVIHICGRSSAHARRRSLRAFHRSAFRYYTKHGGALARMAAPIVYLGLQIRLGSKLLQTWRHGDHGTTGTDGTMRGAL